MKKLIYYIVFILFTSMLLMTEACQDRPDVYEFPTDKYFYEIPDVPVTEDYVVGTLYESIDSNYWYDYTTKKDILYTGTPVLGQYNVKSNPQVILQQLEWGKKAGVDFFIVNWHGHGSDTLIWDYEQYYQPGHPRMIIRFDPGYKFGVAKDTLQYMPIRLDSLYADVDSLYKHLMTKDLYYKDQEGKAVMVFCNFTQSGDIPLANKFIADMRQKVSGGLWIMGELGGGWTSPEYWGFPPEGKIKHDGRGDTTQIFDALYNRNMTTNMYDRFYGYYSFMDFNFNYWQERMNRIGREYVPAIEPAYDNYAYDPRSTVITLKRYKEGAENVYQKLANVAKRNIGKHRIVIINSWNNYREGDNLEPCEEFGESYLNFTREFFKKQ